MNHQSSLLEEYLIRSYYGLSDLILLKGTMNDFSYEQALLYYKQNYDNFAENEKRYIF